MPAWVAQGAPASFARRRRPRLRHAQPGRRVLRLRPLAVAGRGPQRHGRRARACTSTCPGWSPTTTPSSLNPPFAPQVLEEDETSVVVRDSAGITERLLKGKAFNMPTWLDHPVKDRRSWESVQGAARPRHARPLPGRLGGVRGRRQRARLPGVDGGGRLLRLPQHVGGHRGPHVPLLRRPGPRRRHDGDGAPARDGHGEAGDPRHPPRLGVVLGGHGLQERADDQPEDGADLHAAPLRAAQRGHPRRRLRRRLPRLRRQRRRARCRCGWRPGINLCWPLEMRRRHGPAGAAPQVRQGDHPGRGPRQARADARQGVAATRGA